jgi:quercetin dioxygenase-like cupin family protein/DNA-binding XRE family transcriptional regulator
MDEKKPPDIGARVRMLRKRRGLSLRTLAQMCNLSPNTISLIERGLSSPAVNTLHNLAAGLEVPITAFFETEETLARLILTRPHERIQTKCPGMTVESLGSGLSSQKVTPFLVTLEPYAKVAPTPIVHLGEEWVYCLEGVIVYEVEGEHFRLEPGDSLLFEASLPHRWHNPGSQQALVILVLEAEEDYDMAIERHTG